MNAGKSLVCLGSSGLKVSELCFGTLPMSPLQANLALEEGAELLAEAFFRGIVFWDTAEFYDNYSYLKLAIKRTKALPVIATKTYAYSEKGAQASLENARRALDLDIIPIVLLHEQESALTLKGHQDAFNYLLKAKEKGLIQAVGISSHTVAAVKAAIDFPGIDVIHPIINFRGIGIQDGTLEEMLQAVALAERKGIGVYAMKILGGGHLIQEAPQAIDLFRSLDFIHACAIGMTSLEELEANLALIKGEKLTPQLQEYIAQKKRTIKIEDWCTGCNNCIKHCPQEALFFDQLTSQARVDLNRCVLCGYCGAYCPDFCIKIF